MGLAVDLARLKTLIDLVGSTGLSALDLTEGDVRVRIRSAGRPARAGAASARDAVPDQGHEGPVEVGRRDAVDARLIVRAPLSGTFFMAPSPFAPPFHRLGDRIASDSTLCVIEAMKTMTQVFAGYDGTLRDVLVENGAAVEFGQPLFEIA